MEANMCAEPLNIGITSENIESVQYRCDEDTDVAYEAQKIKKLALKDELTEKFLSLYQLAREEVLFLRNENEKLLRRLGGNSNQIEIPKHHKDCKAKVTSDTNFVTE